VRECEIGWRKQAHRTKSCFRGPGKTFFFWIHCLCYKITNNETQIILIVKESNTNNALGICWSTHMLKSAITWDFPRTTCLVLLLQQLTWRRRCRRYSKQVVLKLFVRVRRDNSYSCSAARISNWNEFIRSFIQKQTEAILTSKFKSNLIFFTL